MARPCARSARPTSGEAAAVWTLRCASAAAVACATAAGAAASARVKSVTWGVGMGWGWGGEGGLPGASHSMGLLLSHPTLLLPCRVCEECEQGYYLNAGSQCSKVWSGT